jgi:O-acetyl-ADP-ribose deacetylase
MRGLNVERWLLMISAILGDITQIPAQAIVNSANPSLLAGGGVCGAIHRAAGSQLEAACRLLGRIDPGGAVLTEAYDLPAEFVIHAVAPRFLDGNRGEAEVLAETYRAVCRLASQHGIMTLTVPSIGTGIYRFPLDLAAEIAVTTLSNHLPHTCNASFVCFDAFTLEAYRGALSRLPVKG